MPGLNAARDRQWAEGIRGGNAQAFEALFRAYYGPLCTFVAGHVHSAEVAEDLVHDIFCDLWNRRRDWQPQGMVKAYLYRAARNKALDWLGRHRIRRAWKKEERRREPPVQESPANAAQHRELIQAMRRAVEDLPERRRLIYKMVREQGMSYAEVAAALEISPKTVENQMGRALKFLRKRLSAFRAEREQ